jgi:hypothetical protein
MSCANDQTDRMELAEESLMLAPTMQHCANIALWCLQCQQLHSGGRGMMRF